MSFSRRITKIFKSAGGDAEVQRKRSDGRMKTYDSATDLRAWSDLTEDRRQYILDLVRKGGGKGLYCGKYIPFEAIIDILLANKNATIKRLQQENNELKKNKQKGQTSSSSNGTKLPRKKSVTIVAPVKQKPRSKESEAGTSGQARALQMNLKNTSDTAEDLKSKKIGSGASGQAGKRALKINPKSTSDTARATNVEDLFTTASDNRYSSTSSNADNDKYYDSDDSSTYYNSSSKESEERSSPSLPASRMTEKDLKDALKEQEKICRLQYDDAIAAVEQLENIKNIVEDEPRLNMTPHQIRPSTIAKKVSSSHDFDNCTNEIEMLEKEIKTMDNSSSHEQAMIQRELQVLKKMCEKLRMLQKENRELRDDQNLLKEGLMPGTVDDGALNEKLEKLKQVTSERDRWKARVQKLEQELNNPQDDSDSKLNMRERYMDFRRRLDSLEGVDEEVKKLKEYASRMHQAGDSKDKEDLLAKNNELQQELDSLRHKLQEMEALQADNDSLKKNVEDLSKVGDDYKALQANNDSLKKNLEDLSKVEEDYKRLSSKTKDFDTVLAERDGYKSQCEDLECECEKLRTKVQKASDLDDYYKHLSNKMENFDKLEAERDMYKSRCENLECECDGLKINLRKADETEHERRLLLREVEDCECCMANQENEIKRLIGHIDCLTRELNEREQRSLPPAMVEAFSSLHLPQAVMLSTPCQKRFTPAQATLSQPQIVQPPMDQRACSIRRIVELENTLLFKQKQTKQKIESLQYTLEKFKRELDIEKQKNSDLMSSYTNQSRTVTNMSIEIEIVRRESCQDKEKLKHLNMVLNNILKSNTCQCPPERESSAAIDAMGTSTGSHPNEESYRMGIYNTTNERNRIKKTRSCYCRRDPDSFQIDE